ncbi:MAG: TetR/AcrR family transcriptional regulator [Polyangiales bacterium]
MPSERPTRTPTVAPHSSASPPSPRPRDADATRARLLDAAERLFAKKGLDGTRLREVAEGAQATVPLLCHHFRDKDTLYAAVIDRGMERFTDLGWGALSHGRGIAEQLVAFIEGLIELASREPQVTALLHREMAEGGQRARGLAERWLLPLRDAAITAVKTAQKRGEVRAGLDPEMLVLHLAGAVLYPCLAAPMVEAVWGSDPLATDFVARRKRALVDLILPLVVATR